MWNEKPEPRYYRPGIAYPVLLNRAFNQRPQMPVFFPEVNYPFFAPTV
jgi:hypothetical protein